MTNSTENPEVLGGDLGVPTPTSSPSAQAPSSPADASTIELLVKRLDKLERGEQSNKDKGIAKVATDLKEMQARVDRILELSKSNSNSEHIARELAIDDLLQSRSTASMSEVAPTPLQGKQEEAPVVSVEAVAKLLGLEPNSADYTEAIRTSDSAEKQILSLAALAARRAKASQLNPAPEMVIQTETGIVPSKMDATKLTTRLAELNEKPSLTKSEIEERKTVKAELIKISTHK
jgi:hypothetical protein